MSAMSRKSARISLKAKVPDETRTNSLCLRRSSRQSHNINFSNVEVEVPKERRSCKGYFNENESDSDSELEASSGSSSSGRSVKSVKGKYVNDSPQKNNSITASLCNDGPSTPPKQRKLNNEKHSSNEEENIIMSPKTPSRMLLKLSLNSPSNKSKDTGLSNTSRKSLFSGDIYQNAKKALHSTTPGSLPGRQTEFDELETFIKDRFQEKTSGSLYISGPPGTGKTACLSLILEKEEIDKNFKKVYVNCTSIKSSGAIFSRIIKELDLKGVTRNEKEYLNLIEKYFSKSKKMNLLVLDEMDQLESKNQSVLYTIFEWPAKFKQNIVLIGIANALDLTDRMLPRLQARCELKPELLHFAPYSKQQIVEIITSRLQQVDALNVFSPAALQILAGKVAAVSGDVRRALDIARRVIEITEKDAKDDVLQSIENVNINEVRDNIKRVDMKEVVSVLNKVYGTTQNLSDDCDSGFPLQQKIVICSLLLILQKSRNKDVTIGRLHDVYKKVCAKRNLFSVDQAEFMSLCSLIETGGILRVSGRKEPRLNKVTLEWDQGEVIDALKDKVLISSILQDDSFITKI